MVDGTDRKLILDTFRGWAERGLLDINQPFPVPTLRHAIDGLQPTADGNLDSLKQAPVKRGLQMFDRCCRFSVEGCMLNIGGACVDLSVDDDAKQKGKGALETPPLEGSGSQPLRAHTQQQQQQASSWSKRSVYCTAVNVA